MIQVAKMLEIAEEARAADIDKCSAQDFSIGGGAISVHIMLYIG